MIAKQEKREAATNFLPSISLAGGAMKADDGLLQMPMGGQTLKMVDEGLFGGAFATLPILPEVRYTTVTNWRSWE